MLRNLIKKIQKRLQRKMNAPKTPSMEVTLTGNGFEVVFDEKEFENFEEWIKFFSRLAQPIGLRYVGHSISQRTLAHATVEFERLLNQIVYNGNDLWWDFGKKKWILDCVKDPNDIMKDIL